VSQNNLTTEQETDSLDVEQGFLEFEHARHEDPMRPGPGTLVIPALTQFSHILCVVKFDGDSGNELTMVDRRMTTTSGMMEDGGRS
jgi:hypothetical protein